MIKQTLYINKPKLSVKVKNLHPDTNRSNSLQWLVTSIQRTLQKVYPLVKSSLVKLISLNQNGQELTADIVRADRFFVSRYNFLGTPQVLYVQPVRTGNTAKISSPYVVKVQPLPDNCFELVIESSKPGKEKLDIKIYDESNLLVYGEQVICSGKFTRIYDLKWPQLSGVSFKVTSRYGVHKASTA